MAHQSPMISIPKKTTEDVDWTTPIRTIIAQSYGESPDNYAAECTSLQRCRQDAVRGAGSDLTARDLLYKYFGQLELLELRFSEIRVNFPWHDAFTNKLITQTSIAYEKASILFQIAVTHSSIAASQNRSDPEGLKRAFYYFRSCAGMLTYINENFLHAPSTDLSREVVKFLVSIIMAQATEVFFEKCADEKKANALVAKIGSQAAFMYTSLSEEAKEFMGKGIFDRNWITLIQIKSKYFQSLSHYYRAQVDNATGKHGDALARFILAESLAKEASRNAFSFSSVFVTAMSPNLPADAGPSIHERMKAHLAMCTDRKAEAQRDNDLIYNAIVPVAEALPPIDKTVVATLVPIQEVFGAPDVQKVIGVDLFGRLIPLSVHESASVYSEEKAKLVRGEVERAEGAEGEVKSALDALGVKEHLTRFKAIAEGEIGEELPVDVRRWKEDMAVMEENESVDSLMAQLNRLKERVRAELEDTAGDLEGESRECETMRIKYEHLWTQEPSASLTKSLRQDLKSHFGALEAAASSDQQVGSLWDSVQADIKLLLSDDIEEVFRASTEQAGSRRDSLLDLDIGTDPSDATERARIGGLVHEIEERLSRLMKISRERGEVLKDLKDKIQSDDVSHLLLLNRRNSGVEPKLFAAELEKFRPYQQRLAATLHHQQATLHEVSTLWKTLKDHAGRGPGAKKWDEREKRKREAVRRFSRARDGYMEVRDGLAKGLQFYNELFELTASLRRNVASFVSARTKERNTLASQAEMQKRLSAPKLPPPLAEKPPLPPPPPLAPPSAPPSAPSLESSFAAMNMRGGPLSPPPPSSQHSVSPLQHNYAAPNPYQSSSSSSSSYLPPPPPQPSRQHTYPTATQPSPAMDPYASMFDSSQFSSHQQPSAPPPPPPPQQSHLHSAYAPPQHLSGQFPPPPPPPPHSVSSLHHHHYQQPSQGTLPPPPAPRHPQQQQQHNTYAPPTQPLPGQFPPPPPQASYGFGPSAPNLQPHQQGAWPSQQPQQPYGQQYPPYGR